LIFEEKAMARISINGISFDPVALQPLESLLPDSPTSPYILMQATEALNREQRDELADTGVSILESVEDDTYLLYSPETALQEIRNLPYVRWANVYARTLKVGPGLKSSFEMDGIRTQPDQALMEILGLPQFSVNHVPKTVDVVFHTNVDPETVRGKVAAAARLEPEDLRLSRHKARMTVQFKYLAELAAIDEVRRVEEILTPKLLNNVARRIIGIGAPNPETRFEGEGEIVAVADTGLDIGEQENVHPAFKSANAAGVMVSRVAKLYPLGRPDRKPNDPIGHGTHVAGSVLGDWTSVDGTLRIRGAAPKARLVVQSLFGAQGDLTGLPVDLHDLFKEPYKTDGARIHNNSWGNSPGKGQYNQSAWEVDDFVWNHRDFVICFGAGNEGTDNMRTGRVGAQSITSPGTAKNCITVGATENDRPNFGETYGDRFHADFPVAPISSDSMTNNPEGIAAFSSRGPVQNNRIKPDLVAPGTFILSALSRRAANPGWRPFDGLSYFDGGTSMATPLVAGCAAVAREFLRKEHQMGTPSAALVKAMLINGAKDVVGQFVPTECSGIPNCAEGFGRVDMAATIGPFAPSAKILLKDEATRLEIKDQETTRITLSPPDSLLKVTLVWTDPPGERLQNDLDLIVRTADGQERHGNVDPTSMDFDRTNNVEQVNWTNPPMGDVEIIVRAHRITQLPQSYALVIRAV
jgi:serine protease AprX